MYTSLGLTTLAFIAAGSAKLAGVEQMHLSFALMGLPAWFGYFIGASELAGAVAIWIKKLSIIAECLCERYCPYWFYQRCNLCLHIKFAQESFSYIETLLDVSVINARSDIALTFCVMCRD